MERIYRDKGVKWIKLESQKVRHSLFIRDAASSFFFSRVKRVGVASAIGTFTQTLFLRVDISAKFVREILDKKKYCSEKTLLWPPVHGCHFIVILNFCSNDLSL